nr:CheR family methyltransferase [Candidatus Odyssella thessalonicensis]
MDNRLDNQTISPANYKFIVELLRDETGLSLNEDKEYLLKGRLCSLPGKFNFTSIDELLNEVRLKRSPVILKEIIEALETYETTFFRDPTQFDYLNNVFIPEFSQNFKTFQTLRIWCAACSAGQEAYSLLMNFKENPLSQAWNIQILATDISQSIIAKAEKGLYSHFEAQRGLPIKLLIKYFNQVDTNWQVKEELKKAYNSILTIFYILPPKWGYLI